MGGWIGGLVRWLVGLAVWVGRWVWLIGWMGGWVGWLVGSSLLFVFKRDFPGTIRSAALAITSSLGVFQTEQALSSNSYGKEA